MPINIESLRARLTNISKEKKIDLQFLLNRLAAEQFLYRLSRSSYVEKFIFKGGSLLTYLIDSNRKTRDLDFSIREIGNQVEGMIKIIQSVLDIPVDDGIEWKKIDGSALNHPEMEQPGVRLACHFLFGKMRGIVRMDMALGDVVEAVKLPLERMQYKKEPIFGGSFSLLVYPPETIFAEKLQISLKKGGQNTRMKDYYDLSLLIEHDLNPKKLKKCIREVLANRNMPLTTQISFNDEEGARLQTYWEHFLKREKLDELPPRISDIIKKVNRFLKKIYDQ